ncbi:MAG: pantoate--beta-alanine ligase [Gemmatimonadota bacterium]|nr:pantoate--beta-alanine ligase [Gemmatimonadota bacterium]
MRVIETVAEMHEARHELEEPVAMVATLGGMHAGHEALLERARDVGASLVASLFLNPTQFDDPEDLERYPTDRARDLEIFERHGVDIVFAPSAEEMYPGGASTEVDPGPVGRVLEGAHRPGHFRGVATVVAKILTVLRPDIAVWGAKDAQQNVVIRRLSTDLRMSVRHLVVPTVRATDGLAMSSRNRHLSGAERAQATSLYRGLRTALDLWKEGLRDADKLRDAVRFEMSVQPSVEVEYVSLADPETLEELSRATSEALLSVAARVGRTRLIDNMTLG